jgi:hypothetical protein
MLSGAFRDVDCRLLLARAHWPIPMVKWWALQELALHLVNDGVSSDVASEICKALASCRLETEVLELLWVFWLVRGKVDCTKIDIASCIKAASIGSSMLLGDILKCGGAEGTIRTPLQLAPEGFSAPKDFVNANGTMVPRICFSILRRMELETKLPLTTQYAFEWSQNESLYPEETLQSNFRYFYAPPVEDMAGQFVTRASHRGRSAFLRVLTLAQSKWGLPKRDLEKCALVAMPLDPLLARLRPGRPAWLSNWPLSADLDSASLTAFVDTLSTTAATKEQGTVSLSLSAPIIVRQELLAELDVTLWAQFEQRPVDAEELWTHYDRIRETVSFESDVTGGLSEQVSRAFVPISDIIHNDSLALPTAAAFLPWRHGYLHSDLYSRGVMLPVSTVRAKQVLAQPSGDGIKLSVGGEEFGHWLYWCENWNPYHLRDGRALCGALLTANVSKIASLWGRTPARYFYLWKCTRFSRERPYEHFSKTVDYGMSMLAEFAG